MLPVLDVRESADFLAGHAAESANIPLSELPQRMFELPEKGFLLRVFDDHHERLRDACELLKLRGYEVEALRELKFDAAGRSGLRLWQPSPLLNEALSYTKRPGHACDLACGSGREAVDLATRGWQVDAVDILPDALANAASLAIRQGVEIRTIQRDLRRSGLPAECRYDLICLFRFWHAPLMEEIVAALTLGGVLVIETFHPADPRRSSKTVTVEELAALAAGLEVKISRRCTRNGREYSQLVGVKG